MTELFIVRVVDSGQATYGVLIQNSIPFALTLERSWQNNQRSISCIPPGSYTCRRVNSPKFGNTFEVTGVTGRASILFHKGNIDDDTHGCILVGEQFEPVEGKAGIAASTKGYAEFMQRLEGLDEFALHIVRQLPDDAFFAPSTTSQG